MNRGVAAAGCLALLLGLVTPAAAEPEAGRPSLEVTGKERSPAAYLAAGATPREGVLLAELDHLAAQGVDPRLLTAVHRQATIDSGDASYGALLPIGDLDRVPGRDVLEVVVRDDRTALTARSGLTGKALWQRTLARKDFEAVVPVPALVGSPARPGVLVVTFKQRGETSLEAISGSGRTTWLRVLHSPPIVVESALPTSDSSTWGWNVTRLDVDQRLRSGPPEVLALHERWSEDTSGPRAVHSGDLRLQAVSSANGSVRDVGPAVTADGWVTGTSVGDQDRDLFTDVGIAVSGSRPQISIVKGSSGAPVWTRQDLATRAFARLSPARAGPVGTQPADLVLLAGPDPGVVGSVGVPYLDDDPLGVTPIGVADPTAGKHGQVTLLAARTGTVLWTRQGEDYFVADAGATSRLLVVTDTTTEDAESYDVRAQLDLVARDGSVRWTRTQAMHVSRDLNCNGVYVMLSVHGITDLQGDGLVDGALFMSAFQCDYGFARGWLFTSSNGQLLRDQSSGFLMGSTGRTGSDRYRVDSVAAGLQLQVFRGSDGRRTLVRLVPASQGQASASVLAASLTGVRCADVLVFGNSLGEAAVAVLASDGSPRWWLSGPSTDGRPRSASRPVRAPTPRC